MNNKINTNKLRLEKVDYKNFASLYKLKVKRDQQNFVASNVFSLAEVYVAGIAGGYPQPSGFLLILLHSYDGRMQQALLNPQSTGVSIYSSTLPSSLILPWVISVSSGNVMFGYFIPILYSLIYYIYLIFLKKLFTIFFCTIYEN